MSAVDPNEPVSPLVEAMMATHEIFLSLCSGGFTEKQALYMLGVMMASGLTDQENST